MNKEIKKITRKELGWMNKNIDIRLYKKNNAKKVILVVDDRYRIFIDGQYTCVEKENNPMIMLKESEMPQYIYDFVF